MPALAAGFGPNMRLKVGEEPVSDLRLPLTEHPFGWKSSSGDDLTGLGLAAFVATLLAGHPGSF